MSDDLLLKPQNQFEKIPCRVFEHAQEVSKAVADRIAGLIRQRQSENAMAVLGLATGSTPVGVYDELVRMHQEEGLSFANLVTFNLDEYFPIQPDALQSYVRFMNEHLFDFIDIQKENVHIPDGTLEQSEVFAFCRAYEQKIVDAGGIDIQLLGIGRSGHVGFNEPGSGADSRTRLITLDRVTRMDAASGFFGEENVPRRAITMGVGSILDAREILLLAFGEHKAPIVRDATEGEINSIVAASYLQTHRNSRFMLDGAAAASLTRRQSPWLLDSIEWSDFLIRKAVIWLATHVDKPILKLTDEDYNEEGLQQLLAEHGPAYNLNLTVFRYLQNTITGWPGGKPPEKKQPGDRYRPEDKIFPKRVMIFSPHPDDDVISMGGTLIRLVDQGHDVHVAYQTSGNIAVFDDDARRFCEFVYDYNKHFDIAPDKTEKLDKDVYQFLVNKKSGQVDSEAVQAAKGLIRRGEARAAMRLCGISSKNLHFLDMPFYETGRVKKLPISDQDVRIIVDLIREVKPHQIYAAGDLSDPHGTHRTCLRAILMACQEVQDEDWNAECDVWLYRGAWHEWAPHEIEMAVPLAPDEVMRKRQSIFKHQSQKDRALFPGNDVREFWKRAEDRNSYTARLYDELGMAEYQAIEGFVRWDGDMSFLI